MKRYYLLFRELNSISLTSIVLYTVIVDSIMLCSRMKNVAIAKRVALKN